MLALTINHRNANQNNSRMPLVMPFVPTRAAETSIGGASVSTDVFNPRASFTAGGTVSSHQ